jgi:hypothetical protein
MPRPSTPLPLLNRSSPSLLVNSPPWARNSSLRNSNLQNFNCVVVAETSYKSYRLIAVENEAGV